TDGEALQGFGPGIEADLADLEDIGNGGGSHGFAEELAELDVPHEGGRSAQRPICWGDRRAPSSRDEELTRRPPLGAAVLRSERGRARIDADAASRRACDVRRRIAAATLEPLGEES